MRFGLICADVDTVSIPDHTHLPLLLLTTPTSPLLLLTTPTLPIVADHTHLPPIIADHTHLPLLLQVWYHKCPNRGKGCRNTSLLENGGCAICIGVGTGGARGGPAPPIYKSGGAWPPQCWSYQRYFNCENGFYYPHSSHFATIFGGSSTNFNFKNFY